MTLIELYKVIDGCDGIRLNYRHNNTNESVFVPLYRFNYVSTQLKNCEIETINVSKEFSTPIVTIIVKSQKALDELVILKKNNLD